jgi:hypothetical protein
MWIFCFGVASCTSTALCNAISCSSLMKKPISEAGLFSGSGLDLYSGDARFEFRAGYWLYWLLSRWRQIPRRYVSRVDHSSCPIAMSVPLEWLEVLALPWSRPQEESEPWSPKKPIDTMVTFTELEEGLFHVRAMCSLRGVYNLNYIGSKGALSLRMWKLFQPLKCLTA